MLRLIGGLACIAALFLFRFNDVSVSVIIPCHSTHAPYLADLLDAYAHQTNQPKEVVISLSDIGHVNLEVLRRIRETEYPFRLKWVLSEERLSAGENRNRACKQASGGVLLLQDADDLPHPQRVEIVRYFFKTYSIDHLLHRYVCGDRHLLPEYLIGQIPHLLLDSYQQTESLAVTYGCPALKRSIFPKVRWRPQRNSGEDCVFVQKLFHKYPRSVVVDVPLLLYRNHLSSFSRDENQDSSL